MASRRQAIVREWNAAQARDLLQLPHEDRLRRPGPFGTYPERTQGSAPRAPTLDDDALYTGEYREEVDGNPLLVPADAPAGYTLLATLRRPWPYVGFAIDTSRSVAGVTITAGIVLITRAGHARLLASVVGGVPLPAPQIVVNGIAAPFPWVAMSGIYAGERAAVFAINASGDSPHDVEVTANLWGYNAPGFGP